MRINYNMQLNSYESYVRVYHQLLFVSIVSFSCVDLFLPGASGPLASAPPAAGVLCRFEDEYISSLDSLPDAS